uniref:Opsin n=1 Tax=Podocoryna carnea TaxID=6096 RepID=A9CR57_PODCA|nr:opsin [Podocoryna carnea]
MDPLKIILSSIVVSSIILNTATCFILIRKKRKTKFVILCIHLAISDLLQAVCGYVPELIIQKNNFPTLLCKASACTVAVMALASISLITLISITRIISIKYPFTSVSTSKVTVNILAIISWLYAAFWAICPLLGWSQYVLEPTHRRCSLDWNLKTANSKSYIYAIVLFCYILPITIHVISFFMVRRTVENHARFCADTYGRRNSATLIVERKKLKSFFLSLSMFSIFIVAWTPYTLVGISAQYVTVPTWSMDSAAMLAKSSTLFNPLVYCYRTKFRRKNIFREDNVTEDNITMLRTSLRRNQCDNNGNVLNGESVNVCYDKKSLSISFGVIEESQT